MTEASQVTKDQEITAHTSGAGSAFVFNSHDKAAMWLLMVAALFSALAVIVAVVLSIELVNVAGEAGKAEAASENATKAAQSAIGEAQVATYNFALLQACMEGTKCDPHKLQFRSTK